MATAFDTPVCPCRPFADLRASRLEASTRAITASAELYTEVLATQAQATRALLEPYSGLGARRPSGSPSRGRDDRARHRGDRARPETAARTTRTTRAPRAAPRSARPAAPRRTTRRPPRSPPRRAAAAGRADRADHRLRRPDRRGDRRQAARAAADRARRRSPPTSRRSTSARPCSSASPRSPAPSRRPGYDELNADEAQKLVTNGNPTLAAAVRDYERRHKDRASVIEAAVRHADADADAS